MEKDLTRILFETVIIFGIAIIGFMGLTTYQTHVIDQQQKLIQQMKENPKCMVAPGGNHG